MRRQWLPGRVLKPCAKAADSGTGFKQGELAASGAATKHGAERAAGYCVASGMTIAAAAFTQLSDKINLMLINCPGRQRAKFDAAPVR
jgi:hypothetical protein